MALLCLKHSFSISLKLRRVKLLLKLHLTCDMGSHSVTCHLTQVNTPHLIPNDTGWNLINLPGEMEG